MSSESLILLGLLVVVLVLQLLALLRRPSTTALEHALRAEQRDGRGELREQLEGLARQQDARLETFARNLTELSTRTDQRLDLLRDALGEDARKAREESGLAQQRTGELLTLRLTELRTQLEGFGQQQETRIQVFGQQLTELIARTDTHMAALLMRWPKTPARGARKPGNRNSASPKRWASA